VPVLVLVGEHDAKFRALGTRLASLLPAASCEVIPGAGHCVHLERPAATADAVARWVRAPNRP
jgi:2-succinyl-6-hydroxy-2,4-cyclohexadiene-1-carboxylate synthase